MDGSSISKTGGCAAKWGLPRDGPAAKARTAEPFDPSNLGRYDKVHAPGFGEYESVWEGITPRRQGGAFEPLSRSHRVW